MSDSISPDDSPRKQCSKCKEVLPLTSFAKDSRLKSGHRSDCKKCHKAFREAHIEEARARSRQYDLARREKKAAYRASHKEMMRESGRRYDANHREERKERAKQHRKTAQYKTVYGEYAARNRERLLENGRRYSRTEHGKVRGRAKHQRRRALKMGAPGVYTAIDVANQIKKQRHCCYYCGQKLSNEPRAISVDHIIPLTRGGTNDPGNLVIACQSCNSSKNNKLPHEWHQGGRLL